MESQSPHDLLVVLNNYVLVNVLSRLLVPSVEFEAFKEFFLFTEKV